MPQPQVIIKPDEQQLTPRDDKKKMVSEILKRVDQLIKKNDLDRALSELYNAKEIDPRNVYTLALEERIITLKQQSMIEEEIKDIPKPAPPVAEQRQSLSTTTQTQEAIVHKSPHPPKKTGPTKEELEVYKKALFEAWSDGLLKPEEDAILKELRKQFMISEADHQMLQKEAMRLGYQNSVMKQDTLEQPTAKAPRSAPITQHTPKTRQRDRVLVIDDDPRLLELLTTSLEDSGYEVIALTTSDEAYALLRKFTPDLILCDINLETSTMGGFTFYEKIQQFKHLQHVPFIFLTGLTDEALVRTGKELGVDDYLTKPISEETLLATLRGKLKRFRQLKSFITQQLVTATP